MNSTTPTQKNSLKDTLATTAKNLALSALEDLLKKHEANRTTLLQFINDYSQLVDDLILKTEAQEKLNYQAGNVILKALPYNDMQFDIDLYYQNEQGAWVNKKQSSHAMDMETYLNDEAIAELNAAKEMKFPVSKPEKK